MKYKNKILILALGLITAIAFAAPIDKFDTITTNSPSKLKVDFLKGISFTSTDSIKIPVGTTAQRDVSPLSGMLRLNSTTNNLEAYAAAAWRNLLTFTTNLSVPVEMDMNSHKIINVTDPTSAQEAATKNYVDTVAAGIDLTNYVDRSTAQSVAGLKTFSGNNIHNGTEVFNNTITGSISGNAATVTTNANLTGEVTSVGNAATVTNSAVIGKVLTGYTSGAGTVAATDTILQAIQKLNGNIAGTTVNLTGPITSVGNATSIASQTGTGTKFVVDDSPTIITPTFSGTAVGNISGNAATVTTNANLTGPITSVGNATSVAAQTGTGSTFVMAASPTITTPTFSGTAVGSISGNAATVTTNANLTGEVVSTGNATTVTNAAVIAKTLTGYTAGAGTVSSSDSLLSAIQKLDGNDSNFVDKTNAQTIAGVKTFSSTIVGSVNGNAATVTTNANLTGAVTSTGNATSLGSFSSANLSTALTDETGSGASVFAASPTFTGVPVLAAPTATTLSVGGSLPAGKIFAVASTTSPSKPCPVMTYAQMVAIASPSDGDCVNLSDIGTQANYNLSKWNYGFGNMTIDTDWAACTFSTLAWQGLGTITNDLKCRRSGPNLEMKGAITTGTTAASQAQFLLPNNYGTILTATPGANDNYGYIHRDIASQSSLYNAIATNGLGYFNLSGAIVSATNNPQTVVNGNVIGSGDVLTYSRISIPIAGWASNNSTFSASGLNYDWRAYGSFVADTTIFGQGTMTGSFANPCKHRRVGGDLEMACDFTGGTVTATLGAFILPTVNGVQLNIDTARILRNNTTSNDGVDIGDWSTNGANTLGNIVTATGTATDRVYMAGSYNNALMLRPQAPSTFVANGANWSVKFKVPILGWPNESSIVALLPEPAIISDVKASGTAGGGSTAATEATRDLNTIVSDNSSLVTLASNRFTLQAGTYLIKAKAPGLRIGTHRIKLRNFTDTTYPIIGRNAYADAGDTSVTDASLTGIVTITSAKAFDIRHYPTSTRATDGFGFALSNGDVETYTQVEIYKLK